MYYSCGGEEYWGARYFLWMMVILSKQDWLIRTKRQCISELVAPEAVKHTVSEL